MQKLRSEELFELADVLVMFEHRARENVQHGIDAKLNAAIASVLDAASSVAFAEAKDRYLEGLVATSAEGAGEKP